MATIIGTFIIIAGIMLLGYFAEIIFRKTKIPDVIFLIAAGIIFNAVLGWVNPDSFGFSATLFTNFALVFLLFQGAINLDFRTLFASVSGATALTILGFIFTTAIVTGLGMLVLRLDAGLALLLGLTVGGTSSSVVIPLVNNLPLDKKVRSILTLESAISDVLCIVGSVTLITVLNTGVLSSSAVVSKIISSFSIAIVIGSLIGFFWMIMLAKYKDLANSQMVTIAIVLALYAIIESSYIGASGAIAVLSFGLILGNSKPLLGLMFPQEKSKHEDILVRTVLSSSSKSFYQEISFFVKVFFFVYLGLLIDFSQPLTFLWATIITAGIYLVRPLAVKIVFRKQGIESFNESMLEVMIPKGLAAAVIAQLAIREGVSGAEKLINPVLGIILLSIIFTSVLVFLSSKKYFGGFGKIYFKPKDEAESK